LALEWVGRTAFSDEEVGSTAVSEPTSLLKSAFALHNHRLGVSSIPTPPPSYTRKLGMHRAAIRKKKKVPCNRGVLKEDLTGRELEAIYNVKTKAFEESDLLLPPGLSHPWVDELFLGLPRSPKNPRQDRRHLIAQLLQNPPRIIIAFKR